VSVRYPELIDLHERFAGERVLLLHAITRGGE
jgi:hypothetical protein